MTQMLPKERFIIDGINNFIGLYAVVCIIEPFRNNLPYLLFCNIGLFFFKNQERNVFDIPCSGFYCQDGFECSDGSVLSFGILNDTEQCVHFYLDSEFQDDRIGVHPNENTSTVWLYADDLMKIIREHGNAAEYAEMG